MNTEDQFNVEDQIAQQPAKHKQEQNRTIFYFLAAAMVVALYLPWYTLNASINLGAFGGHSSSISIDGSHVTGGMAVILFAAGACYFKFKNLEWSVLGALGNLILGVLAYFNKLGIEGMNLTSKVGNDEYGSSVEYVKGYGLYTLIAASIVFMAMDSENIKKLIQKVK